MERSSVHAATTNDSSRIEKDSCCLSQINRFHVSLRWDDIKHMYTPNSDDAFSICNSPNVKCIDYANTVLRVRQSHSFGVTLMTSCTKHICMHIINLPVVRYTLVYGQVHCTCTQVSYLYAVLAKQLVRPSNGCLVTSIVLVPGTSTIVVVSNAIIAPHLPHASCPM